MNPKRTIKKYWPWGGVFFLTLAVYFFSVKTPAVHQPFLQSLPTKQSPDTNTFSTHIVQTQQTQGQFEKEDENDFIRPLQDLIPTEEQSKALYEAEEKALASCMNERGFEYTPNRYHSHEETNPWAEEIQPDDVEQARTLGYGLANSITMDDMPTIAGANDDLLEQMSEAEKARWYEAFSGPSIPMGEIPNGGGWVHIEHPMFGGVSWNTESCIGQSTRTVYGDDIAQGENEIALDLLRVEAEKLAENDLTYLNALNNWRNCMSDRGYHYQYPSEAAEKLHFEYQQKKLNLTQLQEKEREIAAADAFCFREVNLRAAINTARANADTQIRTQHAEKIQALQQYYGESIARAESLLQSR